MQQSPSTDVNLADGPSALFQNGAVSSLGTLGGVWGNAKEINDSGLVVGTSVTSNGVEHAFRWDSVNGLLDLNDLIPSGTGWLLTAALAVNDGGQIGGVGTINGQTHGFLLNPPNPVLLKSLTVKPSTVAGSLDTIGTLTFSAALSSSTTVSLSTTNPAAHVPGSITVPAGATSASFTISTDAVTTTQTGAVKASYGGSSKSATLKVRPIGVKLVTIFPSSVIGGSNAIGVVSLEAPAAPGDITVTLTSSNSSVATPDASVTIPAGEINGYFNINTTAVSAITSVTISATANGITKSKSLKVKP